MSDELEVHLELLVGRQVLARNGRPIGRLEEVRATDDWIVTDYLVGPMAVFERLSANALAMVGRHMRPRGYRIRPEQLDVQDPRRPRLTCSVDELEPLE